MYCLKILKSYGGETPLRLVQTYNYSTKEAAVAEAIKCVPEKIEIQWTEAAAIGCEIAFYFFLDGMRFQFQVSKAIFDVPVHEWREETLFWSKT